MTRPSVRFHCGLPSHGSRTERTAPSVSPIGAPRTWTRSISCRVATYELNELLGTKPRALYQRRKGRDLFDLALALEDPRVDPQRFVEAFSAHMKSAGGRVTPRHVRAEFSRARLRTPEFAADIGPLLTPGHEWDIGAAAEAVSSRLIALLPGEPWEGQG